VYLSITVENNGQTEFLVGRMMLALIKGSTNTELPPQFISAFPIISPNTKELIVYVIPNLIDVSVDDTLTFVVSDRLNKVKLSIDISGKDFNEEKEKQIRKL
jgi:hypothetical protein